MRGAGGRGRGIAGQSTIEYLIVAGAIVAALLVVRWQFQAKAANLMNSAINRIP